MSSVRWDPTQDPAGYHSAPQVSIPKWIAQRKRSQRRRKERNRKKRRKRNAGEKLQKIFGNFGWNDLHSLHSFLLQDLDNELWSFALERPDAHRCLETMEDLPFYPILNNETLNWRNHAVQLLVLQFLLQIWYKVEKIFKKTGEGVDVVDFLFITMRRPRQEDLQDQPQVTEVERQWLDGTVKTPLSRHASEGETWKKVKFTRQRTHMKHTIVSLKLLKLFNCPEKWPFWGCHVKALELRFSVLQTISFVYKKNPLLLVTLVQ